MTQDYDTMPKQTGEIARAPNGWVLFRDVPMSKPPFCDDPQPVIFDYSGGTGVFVANFGWVPGALENAITVMRAMGATIDVP